MVVAVAACYVVGAPACFLALRCQMKRRDVIALLGGAAVAWPLTVAAQTQEAEGIRRVGILLSYHETDPEGRAAVALVKKTLQGAGWNDGRNIRFITSWGYAADAIVARVKELVSLSPDVILVSTSRLLKPLQEETSRIPVVFTTVSDPLTQGIVASLARPGGNITGFSNPPLSLVGKSIQILKEVAPRLTRIALAISASNGSAPAYFRIIDDMATSLSMTVVKIPFHDDEEVQRSISTFAQEPNGGMFVPRDVFAEEHRDLFVQLATRYRLPALYAARTFVDVGGLMSYGSDTLEGFRGAATYVDRILRGEKPGDLPVQEPTKFELVVNLKTARAHGLDVPLPLLAAADEVIE